MIFGRQAETAFGKYSHLLAVDESGRVWPSSSRRASLPARLLRRRSSTRLGSIPSRSRPSMSWPGSMHSRELETCRKENAKMVTPQMGADPKVRPPRARLPVHTEGHRRHPAPHANGCQEPIVRQELESLRTMEATSQGDSSIKTSQGDSSIKPPKGRPT